MGYQLIRTWNNKQSNILKSQRFIHNFSLILGGLDISHFKGDFLWYVSGSNAFLYNIREPKYKQNIMRHQISRHKIVQYLYFLNSDIPFWFSYFSASWCHTEIFLYTRRSNGFHLSKEINPRRLFCLLPKISFKQSWVHFFWDTLYRFERQNQQAGAELKQTEFTKPF